MGRKINILGLFVVIALLLCEISPSVTEGSSGLLSGRFSGCGESQNQSLTAVTNVVFDEFCSPEQIYGNLYDSILLIRSQAKATESRGQVARNLVLFATALCLFGLAFHNFSHRMILPETAVSTSIVLFYIHSKDGKK